MVRVKDRTTTHFDRQPIVRRLQDTPVTFCENRIRLERDVVLSLDEPVFGLFSDPSRVLRDSDHGQHLKTIGYREEVVDAKRGTFPTPDHDFFLKYERVMIGIFRATEMNAKFPIMCWISHLQLRRELVQRYSRRNRQMQINNLPAKFCPSSCHI